jgi:hypothetical protein
MDEGLGFWREKVVLVEEDELHTDMNETKLAHPRETSMTRKGDIQISLVYAI